MPPAKAIAGPAMPPVPCERFSSALEVWSNRKPNDWK